MEWKDEHKHFLLIDGSLMIIFLPLIMILKGRK